MDSHIRPSDISERNGVARERTRVVPRSGAPAPAGHTSIIRNPNITRHIEHRRRYETYPHRYYWHSVGGHRYCHYYDGGAHWYGFYHGPHFYWTRYHGGYWWWLDAGYNRWLYWHNGHWWWPAPTGVVYVYSDDEYRAHEQRGISSSVNPPQPPPMAADASGQGGSWTSLDGKRRVEVYGPRSEAFLYDTSGQEPVFLARLSQDVEKARFSGGTNGSQQILLDFKDGTFALFSIDGTPVNAPSNKSKQTGAAPEPPPSGTVPPPTPPSSAQ